MPDNLKTNRQGSARTPKILVFSTGGTIAMRNEGCAGVRPMPNHEGLPITGFRPDAIQIEEIVFSNLPSPHMDLRLWLDLASEIDTRSEDGNVLGAVVLHGTDLLPECALVLELCLKTRKPVVITGSMRAIGDEGYDGGRNLENAIRICMEMPSESQVAVTMADEIYPARHALKKNSVALASMTAYSGLLGRVYSNEVVFFQPLPTASYSLVDPHALNKTSLPKTGLICAFPGQDGSIVDLLLKTGIQGLVVEAFGAGNLPAGLARGIKSAIEKGLPVLITTRCFEGGVYPIYSYEGGAGEMQKNGALLCGNIPSGKALLILQIALACKTSPEKILEFFK